MNHIQMEHRQGDPLYIAFPMVDSTSSVALKSGVSPVDTAYYKDGSGSWTALSITDTASEIGSTGIYEIDLTASETDHSHIVITFAVAGAEVTAITINCREYFAEDIAQSTPQLRTWASSDDNIVSAKQGVTFVGSEDSGSNATAQFADGNYHEISATGNNIDLVYEFTLAGLAAPRSVTFKGYVSGEGDAIDVQFYDSVAASWRTVGTIKGSSSTSDRHMQFALHDDADASGYTYIRLKDDGSSTSPSLFVNELTLGVETWEMHEGYVGGMIWVDSSGTATAVQGVAGTYDNPCTWAAAKTLAAAIGIDRFHVKSGETVTLDAASSDFSFFGDNYTLALGGQDIDGIYVENATVTGVGSGTGDTQVFRNCRIGASTHIAGSYFDNCSMTGTFTVGEAGDYFFRNCYSGASGTGNVTFDYGASIGNTNLNARGWNGSIQIENMGDSGTDTADIEGTGHVIEGTCTGGALGIWGEITVAGITALTVTEDARIDAGQLLDAVVDDATKLDGSALSTAGTDVTAIKTNTDKMSFTASNNLNVNVEEINDYTVTGTGEAANKWRPV